MLFRSVFLITLGTTCDVRHPHEEEQHRNKRSMQQDPVGMLLALAMAPRNQESLRSIVAPMIKNKVQENPGCVERVLCESYKKGEALSGLPYVIWTFINTALSGLAVDVFGPKILTMEAVSRAAKAGRKFQECRGIRCETFDDVGRMIHSWNIPLLNKRLFR